MASAYEAQLRIRREGEERNNAQQDLNSWLKELKLSKTEPSANHARASSGIAKAHTEQNSSSLINDAVTFEDERLRGNDFFANGRYQDAIRCYTRCLGNKDALKSPVVYSNRAMAYLKLKNWTNAEADATSALAIDSNHSKSYQRRCKARISLGKLRAAMMDACSAEDCLEGKADAKLLNEIRGLQEKVHCALLDAVRRAPKRKIPIQVISA